MKLKAFENLNMKSTEKAEEIQFFQLYFHM